MSGRQNNGHQEQDQDDDDFGEFGGFEAADPMESMGAAGGQATASPWAARASASAAGRGQPDLLCPQNTFPTYLDPSGIAGSPLVAREGGDSSNCGAGLENNPAHFQANFNNAGDNQRHGAGDERPYPADTAPMADVLAGTFAANGRLPDIAGLGASQNPVFAEPPVPGNISQNARPPYDEELPAVLDGAEPVVNAVNNQLPGEVQGLGEVRALGEGGGEEAVPVPPVEAVVDEAQQNRLQREIASLQSNNLTLTQELERCQADLAAQRSRLQEVQQQHLEQLEAVRQSGHDALAVVVEQYKEMSRTAVLEQQEASQRHLVDVTSEQLASFQRTLQLQKEENEKEKEESNRRMQEELKSALEALRVEQQEKFDAYLAEERVKHEAAVKQAIEEENERSRQQVQEAIAVEQSKASKELEKAKDEFSKQLEEQRQTYEDMLQEARREEREQAQERLTACLEEERQRGREVTERVLQEARAERDAYIQQQRQSDSALRRRQLASLDLFLESSRRQIDLLLNSESAPPETAPRPSPDNSDKDT
ncbi:hypothetical protein BaRGS_00036651 [Batillaria attramentaria]|uniref:Uncharacterized protein n=1 Tax=Batillaria attramentaria TaxID=370345 RepID=A0ABD0JBA8_9CAEN